MSAEPEVAILVFILQNGQRVRVRFLMVDGALQLGLASLFAALLVLLRRRELPWMPGR